jgi:hypothetical protein
MLMDGLAAADRTFPTAQLQHNPTVILMSCSIQRDVSKWILFSFEFLFFFPASPKDYHAIFEKALASFFWKHWLHYRSIRRREIAAAAIASRRR